MKEFLTFGAASRLFQCLNGTIRTKIAAQFGIRSDAIFTNWLECLVDLRNICAHHDRLFNRSFQKQPARLRNAMVPTAPPQKLKAILECLDHLLQSRGIRSRVTQEGRRYHGKLSPNSGYRGRLLITRNRHKRLIINIILIIAL